MSPEEFPLSRELKELPTPTACGAASAYSLWTPCPGPPVSLELVEVYSVPHTEGQLYKGTYSVGDAYVQSKYSGVCEVLA